MGRDFLLDLDDRVIKKPQIKAELHGRLREEEILAIPCSEATSPRDDSGAADSAPGNEPSP